MLPCFRIVGVLRARQAEIFQVPLDGDEVSDPRTFSSKIAVAELEGKGCGVVATRAISRGEVVLKESPLLGLPASFESASDAEALLNATSLRQLDEDLNSALTSCSQASQDRFWELSDCHGEPKTAAGIALTNALQLGKGGGLLAMSARFNHSCKPNVQGGWDKSQGGGMAVWHALRDISAGEELCFSYVDPYETEAERQSTLQSLFKFQCRCPVCMLQGEAKMASNQNRQQLRDLKEALELSAVVADDTAEMARELVPQMVELLDAELEGSPALKSKVLHVGFLLAWEGGDADLAKSMAEEAWENAVVAYGPDSERATQLKLCASGAVPDEDLEDILLELDSSEFSVPGPPGLLAEEDDDY